jgi:hypothetical protein
MLITMASTSQTVAIYIVAGVLATGALTALAILGWMLITGASVVTRSPETIVGTVAIAFVASLIAAAAQPSLPAALAIGLATALAAFGVAALQADPPGRQARPVPRPTREQRMSQRRAAWAARKRARARARTTK